VVTNNKDSGKGSTIFKQSIAQELTFCEKYSVLGRSEGVVKRGTGEVFARRMNNWAVRVGPDRL
jgi:hypothetical protein